MTLFRMSILEATLGWGVKKPLCITANILTSENISLKLFMERLETIEL